MAQGEALAAEVERAREEGARAKHDGADRMSSLLKAQQQYRDLLKAKEKELDDTAARVGQGALRCGGGRRMSAARCHSCGGACLTSPSRAPMRDSRSPCAEAPAAGDRRRVQGCHHRSDSQGGSRQVAGQGRVHTGGADGVSRSCRASGCAAHREERDGAAADVGAAAHAATTDAAGCCHRRADGRRGCPGHCEVRCAAWLHRGSGLRRLTTPSPSGRASAAAAQHRTARVHEPGPEHRPARRRSDPTMVAWQQTSCKKPACCCKSATPTRQAHALPAAQRQPTVSPRLSVSPSAGCGELTVA